MKNYIVAGILAFTTGASYAQFGGLLNNLKSQVDQILKQDSPPSSSQSSVPQKLNNQLQAQNGSMRQKWLNDPFPDIPNEVTDDDIRSVGNISSNKIFVYLNSPMMIKAYKVCQSAEESRIGERASEMRKQSNLAKTNLEKTQLIEQAKSIDEIKSKISPTTCYLRVVRRATLDLGLDFYGTQPKYGGPLSPDEQWNVVQVFKVARALENNELTSAFHSAMAEEISLNYNDWIEKYLTKVFKENAEELKKLVNVNDRKSREQLDGGAEMGVARRVKFYNQAIDVIANQIVLGDLKP